MRVISFLELVDRVKKACIQANYRLDARTLEVLKHSKTQEKSDLGLYVLDEILDNASIAEKKEMPLCQDTGVSVFFVKWGSRCVFDQGTLQMALDQGVQQAYEEGYLRKSILRDPLFERSNTRTNTPAFVHLEQIEGDQVIIEFLAKGAGADNCSKLSMLRPSDGIEGVKNFILQVCREAGADSCPPWILGIGIGGTFDTVGSLAKHALLREIGSEHPKKIYAAFEKELLEEVNKLGVGPQGLGGTVTALACFVEVNSCHAASLPVAVNIQCHSNRKAQIVI